MEKIYDVLIIGGGVAGMSASVYAKRAGKDVALIEKMSLGGQVLQLERIENFPSQTLVDGITLTQMFSKQVKELGVEIIRADAQSVDFSTEIKIVKTTKGELKAKKIIIATGIKNKTLGIGEEKLLGQGVSYCATCDANFYKNQPVFVASNGGSGIKDALYLSNVASQVTILDSQDMSIYASVNKNDKLKVISNVNIKKVSAVEGGVQVVAEIDNKETTLTASALFVDLGKIPSTEIFKDILKLDEKGYIVTDSNMQTSISGVFAVGDVRNGVLKQIVTACSDGAIAGNLV